MAFSGAGAEVGAPNGLAELESACKDLGRLVGLIRGATKRLAFLLYHVHGDKYGQSRAQVEEWIWTAAHAKDPSLPPWTDVRVNLNQDRGSFNALYARDFNIAAAQASSRWELNLEGDAKSMYSARVEAHKDAQATLQTLWDQITRHCKTFTGALKAALPRKTFRFCLQRAWCVVSPTVQLRKQQLVARQQQAAW